jgi:Na+/H+-dicarboxylate symporter
MVTLRGRLRLSHTGLALIALSAGFLLGWLGHRIGHPAIGLVGRVVGVMGDVWLRALLAAVLPVVVVQAIVAVAGSGAAGPDRRSGRRLLFVSLVLLAGSGIVAAFVAPVLFGLLPVDPSPPLAAAAGMTVPEAARPVTGSGPGDRLAGLAAALAPENLFRAGVTGAILPLLVAGLAFGAALRRIDGERRRAVITMFEGILAALQVLVGWILWATPLAVFAFAFGGALGVGGAVVGALAGYVVVVCAVLVLCTVLLYPVAVVAGRVPLARFARALAQPQLVAISTRSSIAALPALIVSARDDLRLPPAATSVALPLCTSLLKLSAVAAKTVGLVFLAGLYGTALEPGALASFIATVMLLSVSTVGVPMGGATFTTLPAFVAAGIPPEGLVLLASVEAIPDIFKTVLNVTANLTVAVAVAPNTAPIERGVAP